MESSVFELYLSLNKYAVLKRINYDINQLINQRGTWKVRFDGFNVGLELR